MTKTIDVTYVGGLDEVHVYLPSGDTRTVQRGGTVRLMPADAAVLSPDEWTTTTAAAAQTTTKESE
jgi:hypothetical protein